MSVGVAGTETSIGRPETAATARPTCIIVHDQALIGLSLEAYLEEMGLGDCETLSGAAALDWLTTNTPSIAILDYSLKDGPCTRLVRTLRDRCVPFVIYSGHKQAIAPPELQQVPWLTKPCDRPALFAALTRVAPVLISSPAA